MKIETRKLSYLALLVALNIVLTRLFSIRIPFGGAEGIRIGLGGLPIIISGVFFGPLAGGIVGAAGDLIGYFVNPMGPYMPHYTFTAALTGIIPVVILRMMTSHIPKYWQLLVAIAVGQLITRVGLVPYLHYTLFDIPYEVTLIPYLLGELVTIPIFAGFIQLMLKRLHEFLDTELIFAKR